MGRTFLIDTDILIDIARDVPETVGYVAGIKNTSDITISIVTQMEMIVGCRNKKELKALSSFLTAFQVIGLNRAISAKAIELLER